jgi:hypothetical protein
LRRALLWGFMFLLTPWLAACSAGNQSAVEGKLVDWGGKPVAGVKITASQVHPIKGYEQVETVTRADGTFRLSGLYPSDGYTLRLWSDKWTCDMMVPLYSAPRGETDLLRSPIVIAQAFSKNGSLVVDLATGATRFTVSPEGVISDSNTRLEWVMGPDSDTSYSEAEQWLAGCTVAGGGWRMPTGEELGTLYQKGIGRLDMDPAFKTMGWAIWAGRLDSKRAWIFDCYRHQLMEQDLGSNLSTVNLGKRVVGVRSRP